MIKVTLVGTGTVSKHLLRVFSKTDGIHVVQMISSRGDALSKALQTTLRNDNIAQVTEQPDLYIIAVSDDAIAAVSKQFTNSKKLIVHTSGSVSMAVLPREIRSGIFYPLQTFSKGREVDFKTIPICIEADNAEDLELLRTLAESISEAIYEVSSDQRKSLHLAAVFVNNFTNHLFQIGNEICQENDLSFDILKPLIAETIEKISSLTPTDAQTGPAKRNDSKTIERQLGELKNKTHKEVYRVLTKSIKENFNKP
jgi:predicted short-subunit dehydrogenase-like oxidoreductase (DUF2520 family)